MIYHISRFIFIFVGMFTPFAFAWSIANVSFVALMVGIAMGCVAMVAWLFSDMYKPSEPYRGSNYVEVWDIMDNKNND